MVDAVDSKSTLGNQVLVRVRPSAIHRTKSLQREFVRFFHFLTLCFKESLSQRGASRISQLTHLGIGEKIQANRHYSGLRQMAHQSGQCRGKRA